MHPQGNRFPAEEQKPPKVLSRTKIPPGESSSRSVSRGGIEAARWSGNPSESIIPPRGSEVPRATHARPSRWPAARPGRANRVRVAGCGSLRQTGVRSAPPAGDGEPLRPVRRAANNCFFIGFAGCVSRASGRDWSLSVTHRFLRRGILPSGLPHGTAQYPPGPSGRFRRKVNDPSGLVFWWVAHRTG